jgi:hypothetical protein
MYKLFSSIIILTVIIWFTLTNFGFNYIFYSTVIEMLFSIIFGNVVSYCVRY